MVKVRVWRLQVGNIPLYLLDTNTVQNSEDDRDITSYLYGGDRETALKQEIVLESAGFGPCPDGDSTRCLSYERRSFVFRPSGADSSFDGKGKRLCCQEARQAVYANSVFTTHTPVPAGASTSSIVSDVFRLWPLFARWGSRFDLLLGWGVQDEHGIRTNPSIWLSSP